MAKQPFNRQGVDAKLQELAALSDQNLPKETSVIRGDLRLWMATNFDLEPAQNDFLQSLPAAFVQTLGLNLGDAFDYRLPVSIILPADPGGSKFVKISNGMTYSYEGSSGLTITGQLTITLGYHT